MKTKAIDKLLLTLGLFGLFNTGILAQSYTVVESDAKATELIEFKKQSRESARSAGSHAYSYVYGNQETSSRLSLHKHFEGQTTTKDGEFNVEKNVKRMKLNILISECTFTKESN